ncbi:MAG: hypothetical protein ACK56I_16020, partial [bacterium]
VGRRGRRGCQGAGGEMIQRTLSRGPRRARAAAAAGGFSCRAQTKSSVRRARARVWLRMASLSTIRSSTAPAAWSPVTTKQPRPNQAVSNTVSRSPGSVARDAAGSVRLGSLQPTRPMVRRSRVSAAASGSAGAKTRKVSPLRTAIRRNSASRSAGNRAAYSLDVRPSTTVPASGSGQTGSSVLLNLRTYSQPHSPTASVNSPQASARFARSKRSATTSCASGRVRTVAAVAGASSAGGGAASAGALRR